MTPETPKSTKRRQTPGAAEYRFKIDAFTPDTLPLARLAQYLARLADILGEPKYVHLVGIEEGSVELVHAVDADANTNVRARVEAVGKGQGPRDAQTAYLSVNEYLREDGARGVLRERATGPRILEFPGREDAEEAFPLVNQPGHIFGIVVRVGGTGDRIPVLIESEGSRISGCHTDREMAKTLARYLFEHVRLNGRASWRRDAEGQWSLKRFRIDDFEPVARTSVAETLAELRAVAGDWTEEDYRDLERIRHGRADNGGD